MHFIFHKGEIDMSKFDLPNDVFTEDAAATKQFLKDATKAITDIDVDDVSKGFKDIHDNYKNGNTDVIDAANGYLKIIDDATGRANHSVGETNNWLKSKTVDNRSIVARARNSIIHFPVFVSQSIRANEAHIMSQMFERVYASYVQAVIAQNPIVDENEVKNMKFLTKFHTNIKEAAEAMVNEFYEPVDETDAMMKESIFYSQKLTENCEVVFKRCISDDKYFLAENTRLLNEPLTGFPYLIMESSYDDKKKEEETRREAEKKRKAEDNAAGLRPDERIDYTSQTDTMERTLSEDDILEIVAAQHKVPTENLRVYKLTMSNYKNELDGEAKTKFSDESDINDFINRGIINKKSADKIINDYIDKFKSNVKNAGDDGYHGYYYKNGRIIQIDQKVSEKRTIGEKNATRPVDLPQILKDNEIKKINAATPFMMSVTFRVKMNNGQYDSEVKFIIGIKTVLHLINPKDLAEDLRDIVTGKIKSLQKVRYKTGEITFKDYLFNPKGLKRDASKRIQYNKRWLNTLKRLADSRELNGTAFSGATKAINGGNIPIPNGTLILSQADVTALTGESGIDLSSVSNAKRLARNLFLIAVVIVDASAGTMKILYPDMTDSWEIMSISSIESEIAKSDNSTLTRELMRAVNR